MTTTTTMAALTTNLKTGISFGKELVSLSYDINYGNNANYVMFMDAVMSGAAALQLVADIRTKKTAKEIWVNQASMGAIVLVHNVLHSPSMQATIRKAIPFLKPETIDAHEFYISEGSKLESKSEFKTRALAELTVYIKRIVEMSRNGTITLARYNTLADNAEALTAKLMSEYPEYL